jgi:hypothetical protein
VPPPVDPVTVTTAVAVRRVSAVDVAVIVALPAVTPRTEPCAPLPVTVAMAVFDELHVTSLAAPPNVVTFAVNDVVAPTVTDAVDGVIATAATPETVIGMLPNFEASTCDVAVMVAVPGNTPVIAALLPLAFTTTIDVFEDVQFTACDAPFVTATVAVKVALPFTAIEAGAPEIDTDVTVGVLLVPPQFGALTGHLSPPPPPHETCNAKIASADTQRAREENVDANRRGIYL